MYTSTTHVSTHRHMHYMQVTAHTYLLHMVAWVPKYSPYQKTFLSMIFKVDHCRANWQRKKLSIAQHDPKGGFSVHCLTEKKQLSFA